MNIDSQFKKISKILEDRKDLELLKEFKIYHDFVVEEAKERVTRIEKIETNSLKRESGFHKLEGKIHDLKIETDLEIEDIRKNGLKEIYEYYNPIYQNFTNFEKITWNKPRWSGLNLLLFGHKWIKYMKYLNVKQPFPNEVKHE